jgi:hypothetical protein
MTTSPPRLIRVGESLPRLSFRQAQAPGTISWNQGTMASVIFVPHAADCENCSRYRERLGTAVDGLREWATRAMVLTEAPAASGPTGVYFLADPGNRGRTWLGIGEKQAAVIQCDRWGAVYQVEAIGTAGGEHRHLPAPEDLVALAQFIDIQCPECGIPSREWLGATAFPLG